MVARRQSIKKAEPPPRLSPQSKSEMEWAVPAHGVGRLVRPPKGVRYGGREKGKPNKITTALKEVIMMAGANVGYDGQGSGGLEGYLTRLALRDPATYAGLLGKVIPLQIISKNTDTHEYVIRTADELRKELQNRGLPIGNMFEPVALLEGSGKEMKSPRRIDGDIKRQGRSITIEHE
jgi:hypothetical protein